MYMTTKRNIGNAAAVPDLPIPAGEIGVQLEVNILFHNLNDEDISNFQMYLFLPEHFEWATLPSACSRNHDFTSLTKNILSKKSFEGETNDYLICKIDSVKAYEKKNFGLSIIISDYKATQTKYSVLILIPVVIYTD